MIQGTPTGYPLQIHQTDTFVLRVPSISLHGWNGERGPTAKTRQILTSDTAKVYWLLNPNNLDTN